MPKFDRPLLWLEFGLKLMYTCFGPYARHSFSTVFLQAISLPMLASICVPCLCVQATLCPTNDLIWMISGHATPGFILAAIALGFRFHQPATRMLSGSSTRFTSLSWKHSTSVSKDAVTSTWHRVFLATSCVHYLLMQEHMCQMLADKQAAHVNIILLQHVLLECTSATLTQTRPSVNTSLDTAQSSLATSIESCERSVCTVLRVHKPVALSTTALQQASLKSGQRGQRACVKLSLTSSGITPFSSVLTQQLTGHVSHQGVKL